MAEPKTLEQWLPGGTDWLDEKLPALGGQGGPVDRPAMRTDMIRLLADIAKRARERPRSWGVAVSAAGKVIDALDAEEERAPTKRFIDLFGGDERAALAWLAENQDAMRASLEHRVQARQLHPGVIVSAHGIPEAEQGREDASHVEPACEGRDAAQAAQRNGRH